MNIFGQNFSVRVTPNADNFGNDERVYSIRFGFVNEKTVRRTATDLSLAQSDCPDEDERKVKTNNAPLPPLQIQPADLIFGQRPSACNNLSANFEILCV